MSLHPVLHPVLILILLAAGAVPSRAQDYTGEGDLQQASPIYYPGEFESDGQIQDEIPGERTYGYRPPDTDCVDTFVGPLQPGQEALKHHTDLMRYLATHYNVGFPDRYKEYIKRAAKAFELPEQFLVCLFVRESGPNMRITAVSPVGASGIAQLMPDAKTDIIRLVNAKTSNELIQSLKESWNQFWSSGERAFNSKKLNHASFSDPEISIVGGAFWSKFYMERLIKMMSRPLTELEKLLITSAAYNYGLREKLIDSCDEGKTYEECEHAVGFLSHETYTHMKTIRHCMERGNWKSMDRQLIPKVRRSK